MRGFLEYWRDVLIVLVVLMMVTGFFAGWLIIAAIVYLLGAIASIFYWKHPDVDKPRQVLHPLDP